MKLLSIISTISLFLPTYALGPGKVCMFNAPTGAPLLNGLDLGHVGWGYLIGGTSTWVYGATESASTHWHTSGSFSDMLETFRCPGWDHGYPYYLYYKCQASPTSSVGAADKQVAVGEASKYDWDTNNCLSRAVDIFEAYDGSTFDYLGNGEGWGPNFYFDNNLWGFSGRENLGPCLIARED